LAPASIRIVWKPSGGIGRSSSGWIGRPVGRRQNGQCCHFRYRYLVRLEAIQRHIGGGVVVVAFRPGRKFDHKFNWNAKQDYEASKAS
jgi:hypothetical protein